MYQLSENLTRNYSRCSGHDDKVPLFLQHYLRLYRAPPPAQPSRMLSSQITETGKRSNEWRFIFNIQFIPHQSVFIHLWNRWRERPRSVHFTCYRFIIEFVCADPPVATLEALSAIKDGRRLMTTVDRPQPSADAGLCKFHSDDMHNALPQALDECQDLLEITSSRFISAWVHSGCPLRCDSIDSSRTWACLYLCEETQEDSLC